MFVNQVRTPQQQQQAQQQVQQQQQQQAQQQQQQAQMAGLRSMPSPGTPGSTRQSPFPPDGFQPPSSPNAASHQFYQQRLLRTMSAPSTNNQLPGE